ncbi:MAG: ferrous iron transport protein B [Bacteroidetes bacterium]|nr:MAG: ferrous iron transport protein B [Bacteroidota bacterium]TAF93614.1 MAG: ferrous iron transport protein B [Bacteroidota bacterium]
MHKNPVHIALVGNPNSGKSSLFNALTGLNQQVGNFPGVTVDKKTGDVQLDDTHAALLIDLPGTYSLYPRRADEWVAYKVLMGVDETVQPELVLLVADASNLKRNLLFCSQILDLKVPVVVALTMTDLAKKTNINIDIAGLERELGVQIIPVNPRKNKGLPALKKAIVQTLVAPKHSFENRANFVPIDAANTPLLQQVEPLHPNFVPYKALHFVMNGDVLSTNAGALQQLATNHSFNSTKTQANEILQRFTRIRSIMQNTVVEPDPLQKKLFTEKLDNVLLHKVWGYGILLTTLFLLFQSIFWLAQYPMDAIDNAFSAVNQWLLLHLPTAWYSDLLVNGLLAGLNGILVFVPQIMILFGLITILEDSGYMARISFLSDKLMRKSGLNGKSVMPMISGFACAVPAIMSARNIENQKERLLTLLVTPFISCSARLPVYTILITLVVPKTYFLGILSLQGLVMMALYILGVVLALASSYIGKWFIKSVEKSFFILELPTYREPRWKNVLVTMVEKAKVFVVDAGKIIIVISLIIWFTSNYGPAERMERITQNYEQALAQAPAEEHPQLEKNFAAQKLANSYAGIMGKAIEPAIAPLGYDWKIGIALITSFAAREVFVGTMATLYSADEEDGAGLREKMQAATTENGTPVYTLPTALSLMVFYALAMQCMSTLAIVKRETKTWKWPLIQLVGMTVIAYLASWLTYTVALAFTA